MTVVVPDSVAPPGVVSAADTVAALVVTRFPKASSMRTVTAGERTTPATAEVGCTAKVSLFAVATVMLNAVLVSTDRAPLVAVRV